MYIKGLIYLFTNLLITSKSSTFQATDIKVFAEAFHALFRNFVSFLTQRTLQVFPSFNRMGDNIIPLWRLKAQSCEKWTKTTAEIYCFASYRVVSIIKPRKSNFTLIINTFQWLSVCEQEYNNYNDVLLIYLDKWNHTNSAKGMQTRKCSRILQLIQAQRTSEYIWTTSGSHHHTEIRVKYDTFQKSTFGIAQHLECREKMVSTQ